MTIRKLLFIVAAVLGFCAPLSASYEEKEATDSAGRVYRRIPGDPFKARIYTLSNGMKLYLSQNDREPRIHIRIAVRAGSAQDPLQSTGLAHYFEHMMFKGNDRIASLNWTKEKELLQRIEALFEEHRKEQDPEKRAAIYKKIDELSLEASQYSNDEYWLLAKTFGAEGTNAYTSLDETVYYSDIPASELERFLKLEAERFSSIALRRFHTELEAVYEEFNMRQDRDWSCAYEKLMELLFVGHAYGRSVIGLPEHLKAPSMKDIGAFFQTWYRPENMALILSGAIDCDRAADLAEKYFGKLKAPAQEKASACEKTPLPPIDAIRRADISGPQAELLIMGYRFPASKENERMLDMIGEILSNGQCGLIDRNVNLPQKVLSLSCDVSNRADYLACLFIARPKAGQSLDEVKDIILAEVEKLRNGDFPDWLPGAVVNNQRLSLITCAENRSNAANVFTDSFIRRYSFADTLNAIDEMEKLTKADITDFAKKHFRTDNYAIVYKHSGTPDDRVHAVKPPITPVKVPEELSDFAKELLAMPKLPDPEPVFPDFKKDIAIRPLAPNVTGYSMRNKENERFSLSYVIPAGSLHDLRIPLAFSLASYLGCDGKTAAERKEELYRLAGNITFGSGYFRSTINISGLARNFDALLKLKPVRFEPDEKAWAELRASLLKERENAKKDQRTVFTHASRYVYYKGLDNLSNLYLPEEELMKITAKDLTDLLHKVMEEAPLDIVYYGPEGYSATPPADKKPRGMTFRQVCFKAVPLPQNQVVLVDYPSVQVIAQISRLDSISQEPPFAFSALFSEYGHRRFWAQIREKQGLAYSAGAYYSCPRIMIDDYSSSDAYILTQPDKLTNALDAMLEELDKAPLDLTIFESEKNALLSYIRNERTQVEFYYSLMKDLERRGLTRMPSQIIYEALPGITPEHFAEEIRKRVSGRTSQIVIIGDLKKIDREALKKYGTIRELKLDDIFRK